VDFRAPIDILPPPTMSRELRTQIETLTAKIADMGRFL
jgi:hypothetical protein